MNEIREKTANYIKSYSTTVNSERIIKEQLFDVERLLHSLRTSNMGSSPNHGGSSRYEDFLVSQISKKEELRLRLLICEMRKNNIIRMLDKLPPIDRKIIDRIFINGGKHGAVEDLMDKLGFEKSHIYRMKDRALDRLAEYMAEIEGDVNLLGSKKQPD